MTLAPGTTVGRYQILEPLGQGGMATVYKAFQPSLQREVALKVLRPGYAQDQEFRERFEREAIAIAKLRHPHIVQVFDFEVAPSGEYVLAMEFLEGGTLKERLTKLAAEGRGIGPAESVRIVGEVASALSYAHEKGIVHRDVKPSNVMLTQKDWAVVTDFGIARILGATSHTQTGVGIGTPEYMAPEQGQGAGIDHRADIYSLGAMAYELLTGRVPYSADTPLAVVLAHIKDPLPLPSKINPTIGKGVEKALLKALAKDPSQRFETATGFAEALKAGLAEDTKGGTMPTVVVRGVAPVTAAPARPAPAAPKQVTLSLPPILAQRPVALGVAGALVLAIVVGGVVAGNAFRSSPTPSVAPTRSTTSAAAPASTVPSAASVSAIPPRGPLIVEARMDGTGADLRPPSVGRGAPADTRIAFTSSAIELSALGGTDSMAQTALNQRLPESYIAEIELSVQPGSEVTMIWAVRQPALGAQRGYVTAVVRTAEERLSFHYWDGANTNAQLAGPFVIQGMQTGRKFIVAVVIAFPNYTVFIDEKEVARFSESRIGNGISFLEISNSDRGRTGTVKVSRLRFYELPKQ